MYAIGIAVMTLLHGCSYDDSDLRNSVENLNDRVTNLETLCRQMNSDLSALQTILTALQAKEYVEQITELNDGSGYTLTLSSGKTMTIRNGKDGQTPAISVRKDTDGIWYWTLDGEWLLGDGGKKVAASAKDGKTPQLKISEGYWYVSTDGGKSWASLGEATGDSFFRGVTVEADTISFELSDGTVIAIPLASASKFNITFDYDSVPVLEAGAVKTVNYSITKATDKTVVKTIAQNGWTAVVNQKSNDSGEITVQAPNPIVPSEILVFASDGEGQTVMAVLDCVKGSFSVAKTSYMTEAGGGEINLSITTNMQYDIIIPDYAQSWISVKETTKATTTEIETLVIQQNTNCQKRFATIKLSDNEGTTLQSVEILQEAAAFKGELSVTVTAEGTLSSAFSSYSYATIQSVSISGPLNEDDYTFIRDELQSLRKLNLSGATGAEPIFTNHKYTLDLVILPDCQTAISANAFAGSYVVQVVLPENLQSIGAGAFLGCSKITGEVRIPQTVTYIGAEAFAKTGVESFILPDGIKLTKFEDNCLPPKILSLRIPASVQTLTASAFSNLYRLKSLTFEDGSGITEIPALCFANLPLENVILPQRLKKIGGLIEKPKSTTYCHGDTAYGGAFENCTSLQSIVIPKSVEDIEAAAFFSSGLKSITFENGCKIEKLCGLSFYQSGVGHKRIGAFSSTQLETVTIPENVTEIQDAAFADCQKLMSVDFSKSKSLKIIGGSLSEYNDDYYNTFGYPSGAFYYCTGLQRLDIPSSVEVIQAGAFSGCSGLVSIQFEEDSRLSELPGSMLRFDTGVADGKVGVVGAFSDCSSITEITIPASVRTVRAGAFCGCTSLTNVSFAEGSNCEEISGALYTYGRFSFSFGAFSGTNITKMVLPSSLKIVSSYALSGMTYLTSIRLESGGNVEFSSNCCMCGNSTTYGQTRKLSEIDASEASFSAGTRSFACGNSYCPISIVKIGSIRPPACAPDAFGGGGGLTLYVPTENSVEYYKQAEGWNRFSKILPL